MPNHANILEASPVTVCALSSKRKSYTSLIAMLSVILKFSQTFLAAIAERPFSQEPTGRYCKMYANLSSVISSLNRVLYSASVISLYSGVGVAVGAAVGVGAGVGVGFKVGMGLGDGDAAG